MIASPTPTEYYFAYQSHQRRLGADSRESSQSRKPKAFWLLALVKGRGRFTSR